MFCILALNLNKFGSEFQIRTLSFGDPQPLRLAQLDSVLRSFSLRSWISNISSQPPTMVGAKRINSICNRVPIPKLPLSFLALSSSQWSLLQDSAPYAWQSCFRIILCKSRYDFSEISCMYYDKGLTRQFYIMGRSRLQWLDSEASMNSPIKHWTIGIQNAAGRLFYE